MNEGSEPAEGIWFVLGRRLTPESHAARVTMPGERPVPDPYCGDPHLPAADTDDRSEPSATQSSALSLAPPDLANPCPGAGPSCLRRETKPYANQAPARPGLRAALPPVRPSRPLPEHFRTM